MNIDKNNENEVLTPEEIQKLRKLAENNERFEDIKNLKADFPDDVIKFISMKIRDESFKRNSAIIAIITGIIGTIIAILGIVFQNRLDANQEEIDKKIFGQKDIVVKIDSTIQKKDEGILEEIDRINSRIDSVVGNIEPYKLAMVARLIDYSLEKNGMLVDILSNDKITNEHLNKKLQDIEEEQAIIDDKLKLLNELKKNTEDMIANNTEAVSELSEQLKQTVRFTIRDEDKDIEVQVGKELFLVSCDGIGRPFPFFTDNRIDNLFIKNKPATFSIEWNALKAGDGRKFENKETGANYSLMIKSIYDGNGRKYAEVEITGIYAK